MANFWDSASEGFNRGVPLGVRNAEWSENNKRLDRQEGRDTQRLQSDLQEKSDRQYERSTRLGMETESHDLEVAKEKAAQEERDKVVRQKNFKRSVVIAKALAENGDERPAFKLMADSYNKMLNNGDEMLFISKDDKPDDPKWKEFPEDTKYLIASQQYGVHPFKSVKDFMKIAQEYTDPDKFFDLERTAQAAVDDKNATEKPFRGQDNKVYVKKWALKGNQKEMQIVPYEGPTPMNAEEEKVRSILNIPDNLLSKEGKKVVLGLREKEKTEQPGDLDSTLKRLRINALLTDNKDKEVNKKVDALLKRWFAPSERYDEETGTKVKVTPAQQAEEILADPKKGTKEQFAAAKRIQGLLADSDTTPTAPAPSKTEAEKKLKARGYVKGADGKWTKPKGKGATKGF